MELEDTAYTPDRVGKWTEVKLEIIQKYARAYCTILKSQSQYPFYFYYIDAFSGSGYHLAKDSDEVIKGSPMIVLDSAPDFCEYHFIDLDEKKGESLKEKCRKNYPDKNIYVYPGKDCNKVLLNLFPKIIFGKYKRALCLLDPYGLHFNWEVVEQAGKMKTIELLLNFPVMDMQRDVLRHDQKKVTNEKRKRMDKFWGDDSWEEASYKENPQGNLFGDENKIRKGIDNVVEAYRKRLKDRAGFKYVSNPLPMRHSKNAILYYLIFMSTNKTADKIMKDIFTKYKDQ